MSGSFLTTVRSPTKTTSLEHYFLPALAVEIGLREGAALDTATVKRVEQKLIRESEQGLWRWNSERERPHDYDDTITARNVLTLLGHPPFPELPLSRSPNGGIYTYLGGKEHKPTNATDVIVNLRILDYLRMHQFGPDFERLASFIRSQNLAQDVTLLSKYYLSNGFLAYVASKVADVISPQHLAHDVNVSNATDAALFSLATRQPMRPFTDTSPLELFRAPAADQKFSCPLLDEIVRTCASRDKQDFDHAVAHVYTQLETLYDYFGAAADLSQTLAALGVNPPSLLVELAIGTANLTHHVLDHGYSVFGVDRSNEMLARAREKTKPAGNRITLQTQDVQQLHLPSPARAMYTSNFIDVAPQHVEYWAQNKAETHAILDSIARNLQSRAPLFIHKQQPKRPGPQFILRAQHDISQDTLTTTYFYQDDKFTIRRSRKKITTSHEEFKHELAQRGIKHLKETQHWHVYQKD